MAKAKEHYYVVVFTQEGPKYVTKIGEGKTAYWDMLEPPKEFSKEWARDLTFGLLVNGYNAQTVMSPIELDSQPFYYSMGHFKWVDNKEENEDAQG